MIKEFVERYESNKQALRNGLATTRPESYEDLVKRVVSVLADEQTYRSPDPERVHKIDDGDYQGTLIFIIGAKGYQPSDYWYVKVGYGSCSGCDTLAGIRGYGSDDITEEQINEYLTLCLHIVQGLRKMGDDYES